MKYGPYSVVITSDLVDNILTWFSSCKPKEAYLFIGGKILSDAEHCYKITHLHMPEQKHVGRHWIKWCDEDRSAATVWAAKDNVNLLGIAHSHIYDINNFYGITQSYQDAQMQSAYHFPLSLVVGFFGEETGAAFWLNGYAAPLEAYVKQNRKSTRLADWLEQ